MKIFIIVAVVLLVLALFLPYLNFQYYITALSNVRYVGEVFGAILSLVAQIANLLGQYQILISIVILYSGLLLISWLFGLI